jgi:hypothetical protein
MLAVPSVFAFHLFRVQPRMLVFKMWLLYLAMYFSVSVSVSLSFCGRCIQI